MKTDRLLSIVIYLLNHDTVSAAKLAERFEVSKRTIVRDMEHISMAVIPIRSIAGARGGYSIMEGYKLDGRMVTAEDSVSIIAALQGFASSYDSRRYDETLEKITSILPKHQGQSIFLDFGASGEGNEIQAKLKTIEAAINKSQSLDISYVNASGDASTRLLEPIALSYRWYAWYLLAFCTARQDYRIFKLARISSLKPTSTKFSREHAEPDHLLEKAFQGVGRKYLDITLLCKADIEVQVCEYLDGYITETRDNGDFIMHMQVPEDERIWFAVLLSFGDKVTVLEPESLKTRLTKTAKNILSLYEK